MSEKDTYPQKYLDEKFDLLNRAITELQVLISQHIESQNKSTNDMLVKLGELRSTDRIMDIDIKAIRQELKDTRKLAEESAKNNFFSVKGVIFVTTIFAVLMTAFLLNGMALLDKAL